MYQTFKRRFSVESPVPVPRRVPVCRELPESEVSDGEPHYRGLVQLRGDGARQRQHLGQLVKFIILLPSPRPRRVSGLFFSEFQDSAS